MKNDLDTLAQHLRSQRLRIDAELAGMDEKSGKTNELLRKLEELKQRSVDNNTRYASFSKK